MANQMSGTFKGEGMILTVTPEAKNYNGMVNPNGGIRPQNLSSFFSMAVAENSGVAVLKKGDIEINLKYDYSKNIVTFVDSTGMKILFCFMFDKLYGLDPAGDMVTVLSR